MADPSTLERLITDKHLLAMQSEPQRVPWFQIQGHPAIGCTKTGSSPGGPLADLMYNLAMLPAIKEIDQQLVAAGHCFQFPSDISVVTDSALAAQSRSTVSPASATAFVDDLSGTAPLNIRICSDIHTFEERITDFVLIFVSALHIRGMILNCKPGKSAIMISLSGQKFVQASIWLGELGGFPVVGDCKVQLVPSYRLLGGMLDSSCSLGPEIYSRQAAVSKISAPYHKYGSTKVDLPLWQSVTCINAMTVSSLLFNAHTWCNMSEAQLHQINSRLATAYGSCIPYRTLYLESGGKYRRLSDKHIFAITNMPDAYRQLRYRRLLFLPSLLRAAPASLLRVLDTSINQEGSFAYTILSDPQWMGEHSYKITEMEAPPATHHQWLNSCAPPFGSHCFAMRITMIIGSILMTYHIHACYMTYPNSTLKPVCSSRFFHARHSAPCHRHRAYYRCCPIIPGTSCHIGQCEYSQQLACCSLFK